jgi:hypothetical protein
MMGYHLIEGRLAQFCAAIRRIDYDGGKESKGNVRAPQSKYCSADIRDSAGDRLPASPRRPDFSTRALASLQARAIAPA